MNRLRPILEKEIFLILLPLFFVLHGYVSSFPAVPINDAAFVLVRYVALIVFLLLINYLLFRHFRKAAWFTFWLFVLQFFFGPLHDGIRALTPTAFYAKHIFLFPFFIGFFIIFFVWLKKTKREFTRAILFINTLLVFWLLIDLGSIVFKSKPWVTHSNLVKIYDSSHLPDVYFIIADEYASANALRNIFAFDNTSFEDSLRKKGFYIIQNSHSNYNYTPYSVGSILSMNYLHGITKRSNDLANAQFAYKAINNNAVINEFTNMGYEFINLSPFDFAGKPTQVNTQFFLTRERLITGQTYTQRLFRDIGFNFVTKYKIKPIIKYWTYHTWEVNKKNIADIKKIAAERPSRPRFVYTHLFMPHYPYYFNEEGKPFPVETLVEGEQVNKQNYIAYLKYSNKRFVEILDHILKSSKAPPVILFMGDHGFRHFDNHVVNKYHFSNFNAVYLPSKNYTLYNNRISGVNHFRILLNTQFNKKLPLLKDSTSFLVEY